MRVFINLTGGSSGGPESRSGAGDPIIIDSAEARLIADAMLLGYISDLYVGEEGLGEALGMDVEADWESPYTTRIIFRGVNGEPGLTMDVTKEHDDLAIAMLTGAVMYFAQQNNTPST